MNVSFRVVNLRNAIAALSSKAAMGHDLTYGNDWYRAANLALHTGSIKFKFPSALKVPKHLRHQCRGTAPCFPTWCVLRAIAQHECFWYGDRSKMLWCGESCGCHHNLLNPFVSHGHSLHVPRRGDRGWHVRCQTPFAERAPVRRRTPWWLRRVCPWRPSFQTRVTSTCHAFCRCALAL